MSGCSSSSKLVPQNTSATTSSPVAVVPGYSGGCKEGFTIWTQNQFSAAGGGYGSLVHSTLSTPGQHAGLNGNNKLTATGWFNTGESVYPDNPAGIRGEVWYYIPQLPNGGAGWVSDAGVRAVQTSPAPSNRSSDYHQETQEAPQPEQCKLTH
jgi:hypothetical protein